MNVQAVCDADCKVIALTVKHCGSTNDASAYVSSELKTTCESQSYPYHWVGDAAYPLSTTMMVPYSGTKLHLLDPPKDWLNFWQSQVRITIERCFGIFMKRWGIFWKPLASPKLENSIAIIHACFRLHNFILKHEGASLLTTSPNNSCCAPAVNEDRVLANAVWRDMDTDRSFVGVMAGSCSLRERYYEIVKEKKLCHPRSHH
jgi:hypothetical protein